jgi:hypothetical protein
MKSALLFAIISKLAYGRLPSVQGQSANNIAITGKNMTLCSKYGGRPDRSQLAISHYPTAFP